MCPNLVCSWQPLMFPTFDPLKGWHFKFHCIPMLPHLPNQPPHQEYLRKTQKEAPFRPLFIKESCPQEDAQMLMYFKWFSSSLMVLIFWVYVVLLNPNILKPFPLDVVPPLISPSFTPHFPSSSDSLTVGRGAHFQRVISLVPPTEEISSAFSFNVFYGVFFHEGHSRWAYGSMACRIH